MERSWLAAGGPEALEQLGLQDLGLGELLLLHALEAPDPLRDRGDLDRQGQVLPGQVREQALDALEGSIHGLAGEAFNIKSSQQLGRILFEKLQLPVQKKTKKKTGYSTDVNVLTALAEYHELPALILRHRTLAKLMALISVVLLVVAYFIKTTLGFPKIHGNCLLGLSMFIVSIIMTVILIVWSASSLRPRQRGRELITGGAFRYFRHPLYAAFLTFFNFGLSFYLDNYIYIIWAVLQHLVWHVNVTSEEKMISNLFPEDYREYSNKTGRFIPRFW